MNSIIATGLISAGVALIGGVGGGWAYFGIRATNKQNGLQFFVQRFENEIKRQDDEIARLDREVDETRQKQRQAEDERDELKRKVNALERDRDGFEAVKADLRREYDQQLSEKVAEIKALNGRITRLTGRVRDMEKAFKATGTPLPVETADE